MIEETSPGEIYSLVDRAIEYWTKAAGLGDAGARYQLSVAYQLGQCAEKDEEKEVYHNLEEAAIGGHVDARYNLGVKDANNFKIVKHWIIAANLGHDNSLKTLKDVYADRRNQSS